MDIWILAMFLSLFMSMCTGIIVYKLREIKTMLEEG